MTSLLPRQRDYANPVFLEKHSYQFETREQSGCLRMSHQIYIQCNLFSVPWQGCAAAAAAASPSATTSYHHIIDEGHINAQFYWNGQTIPLIGGYQAYVMAPMPTPVEEKPLPRRAPKRPATNSFSDEELGCPPAKIQRLQPTAKRETPQKRAGRATAGKRARR
ncbi:DPEP2 neighbor protein-like [Manis pentadactyla]|uniref:DPEP2 neighbor protein-like n=1 Tax=Manis pentadactyla TaxID=143292 RepID=UPI00255CF63A|nr:DPEP2 neighbor protein-like [Manis pentadactyla]